MLAFKLCADNKSDGPCPLSPHCFQKQFLILIGQITGQLSTLLQSILNELRCMEDSRVLVYMSFVLFCFILFFYTLWM